MNQYHAEEGMTPQPPLAVDEGLVDEDEGYEDFQDIPADDSEPESTPDVDVAHEFVSNRNGQQCLECEGPPH